MTGGYSLIDCFDVNITSDPVKIEGIFKKYQTSKRKAFLLSNVTINNTQLNDVFSTPYFEDGKVCFPAYDGVIKISDTDYVTFEATADVIADKYLSKEEFLTVESDNTPYVSRSARDGLVKLSLAGATVAWNQLVDSDTESVTIPSGRKYILYHDSTYTLGTSDGSAITVSSGDMFFDITLMFGTSVANVMNTALFASLFPKTNYAYDAGSLQSVCTSGRKITALDGSTRTYPIDNEELRGLFKLDANNKLYADGDIYNSDGAITRKYAIIDLGEQTFTKSGTFTNAFSIRFNREAVLINSICSKYVKYNQFDFAEINNGFLTTTTSTYRYYIFKDDAFAEAYQNNTPNDVKSMMNGVYLVYELGTPTTDTADPYINPQRSEGTEEFIDGQTRDVMIPVGNNSTYYKDELFNIIGEYIDSSIDAVINMIHEDQDQQEGE